MGPNGLRLRRRVLVILLASLLAAMALVGRVAYVQLGLGPGLRAKGLEVRLSKVPVQAPRGEILDAFGRRLAYSVTSDSVYAIPAQVRHRTSTVDALARILNLSPALVSQRIKRRTSFVWLKRRVPAEVATMIRNADLPGIGLSPETRRVYPEGMMAAQVLGIAGVDNQGLDGVELSYNKALEGTQGAIAIEVDAYNRAIPGAASSYRPPRPGDNVRLTLDVRMQKIAEHDLRLALQQTGSKSGTVVMMNPNTGGIVALANDPSYNPNDYQSFPASLRRDPAVSDDIPPGSTFKPVTVAAALSKAVVQENSQFYCPGYVKVNGRIIRCWRHGGHGSENLAEVVRNSCNVGFVEMALRLGVDNFYAFLKQFNLTRPTGVDLPGEASSILPAKQLVKPVDLAVMGFGQTLAITPLQLTAAISAIADGGVYHRPHVMDAILSPQGKVLRRYDVAKNSWRIISEAAAADVTKMMAGVVDGGTGKNAQVAGYRFAGKTGTAQAVIDGHYVEGKYISSFIGFGPLPHPRLVTLVVLHEPTGLYYGGLIAAPVFAQIMSQTLPTLGIEPDPQLLKGKTTVPDFTNMTLEAAKQLAARSHLRLRTLGGSGTVLTQVPVPGALVSEGTEVLGFTRGPALRHVAVPDLTGLTPEQAALQLDALGLRLHTQGSGRVVRQQPSPGRSLVEGDQVHVELEEPGPAA